ncbi:MAG TPA: uroporphyrinogen-III C-methyltransferase [Fimbriiglobus sp.]
MNPPSSDPHVFLVGAGPGAAGLLTLRAAEVLARADLVVHDQLVPRRILDLANPGAEIICVRDLPGQHPEKYPHIYSLLVDRANLGQCVVRLKGGDPLVFGRGGEEAEALRAAGVAYEIVPGVTAALAASAFLDMPLTHRGYASAVALITGHELPSKPGNRIDWEALAKFPGTLAIYMGIARLPLIVAELIRFGKRPETPACVVERAGTGDMRSVTATLASLDDARRQAGLEAPGLILIGEAVTHRRDPSWFESRPLFGQRVLVTRPRHQAETMIQRLESLGAVTYHLPAVEIRPPTDPGPLDAAIRLLNNWQWIVFTSANGVDFFVNRVKHLGLDLRVFGGVKLAAIGPKTAAALRGYHLEPDTTPPSTFSSEGLAATLAPHVAGTRVLLARANRGREFLSEELSKTAVVDRVTVYDQIDAADPHHEAYGLLRRGEIRFVALSSSNVAKAVLAGFDETTNARVRRGEIELVAISPETGRAIRELGYPVAAEAERFTAEGLIDAVISLAKARPHVPHPG